MQGISKLKDKAFAIGANAVLPTYSKVASKVTELASHTLKVVDEAQRFIPGRPSKESPTPSRPSKKRTSTRPRTGPSKGSLEGKLIGAPEPARPEDLPLIGYDALVAEEILVRLKGLTQSELAQIYKYEKAHDDRSTVLETIEARLVDLPLPTYDSLKVAAILDAVNGLTRKELYTIHEYERMTRNRLPIIEKVETLLAS